MIRIWLFIFLSVCLSIGSATAMELTVFGVSETAAGKSAVRAVSTGKALKAAVKLGKIADTECAVFRVESGEAGAKDAWAALGFQFSSPATARPVGMRWRLCVPDEMSVTVEAKHNADRAKGFWNSRRVGGVRNFQLKAGEQNLDVFWNDLGISDAATAEVNAGVLVLNAPGEIGVLSFSLLLPDEPEAGAGREVVVYDPGMVRDNPVARPNDALLMGLNAFGAGKGFRSLTEPLPLGDGVEAVRWTVEGPEGEHSWAAFCVGLTDMPEPGLTGMVFDIDVPAPVRLEVQPQRNFNRHKGFYGTTKVGRRRYLELPPGRQRLLIDWGLFDVPAAERPYVNAVSFAMFNPGDSIDFLQMSMIYPTREDADHRRREEAAQLENAQRIMIQSLKARHVDWSAALSKLPPSGREALIWDGVMLAAQREQLAYFGKLDRQSNRAGALLEENEALIQAGMRGEFDRMRSRAETLQERIDGWIDEVLAANTVEDRRFRYDESERVFRYPDGRRYRMFGPHFFRAIYDRELLLWRKWDLRYLAGLGFNGIRLHVVWKMLEPERGKFDPEYLDMLKEICAEAERYGFGVSFDLHWPYPAWFTAGKPGEEPVATANRQNSYHWPEAVVETWRNIGREFAAVPNIVAFEVPTNETPIGNDPDGLCRYPSLLARWNSFLQEKYRTREALAEAWNGVESLLPEENWENNSILPLGFRNPGMAAEEVWEKSPRFYDHLQFCADLQKHLSGEIVRALRENIPTAHGMFQPTIGDMWDKSPVPVDYHAIMTSVGENVIAGNHYTMGGLQARKAVTLSPGSYDSEQQMENNSGAVRAHVNLGGGFCPFAFHYYGGGGMLLCDNGWHLKKEVAFLPEMAEYIRTYEPEIPTGLPVAVIVNSRLEASTGHRLGDLIATLEKRGCRVGVFESLRILDEPELLKSYLVAVTNSGYADPALLEVLRTDFSGTVFLHGRLDCDAYARTGVAGLPGYLMKRKLLLKTPELRRAAELSGRIDLSGNWEFFFDGPRSAAPTKALETFPTSETMKVPGKWGETGITGSLQYRIGDGWYARSVTIPAEWKARPLKLRLGAVDDLDWVFFNGQLIGHTGEDQANYWMTAREYEIPEDAVRWGGTNELRILVRNLRDDGGIWKEPVEISGNAGVEYTSSAGDVRGRMECGEDTTLLEPGMLADDVEILGRIRLADGGDEYAGLIRHGKFFWFCSDQECDGTNPGWMHALECVLGYAGNKKTGTSGGK